MAHSYRVQFQREHRENNNTVAGKNCYESFLDNIFKGKNSVNRSVLSRLFESFAELDSAIRSARDNLRNKPQVDQKVLDRISAYEAILTKQRFLANQLCRYLSQGNIPEVERHVKLINGLSGMIRDDARDLVMGNRVSLTHEQKELTLM